MSSYKRKTKLEVAQSTLDQYVANQIAGEYTRDNYLVDFESECIEMLELTKKKNNDYGGHTDPFKNFKDFGELGILVRMSDKFARLKTALYERRDLLVNDESVDDTIRDLAVYSIILKIWRKIHKNNVQNK